LRVIAAVSGLAHCSSNSRLLVTHELARFCTSAGAAPFDL
jgi:hypothetical protein